MFGAKPVWYDDFKDNRRGWKEFSSPDGNFKVENGAYHLISESPGFKTSVQDVRDFSQPFRISVSIKSKRREHYSRFVLVWSYLNEDNHIGLEFVDNHVQAYEVCNGVKHELSSLIAFQLMEETQIDVSYCDAYELKLYCRSIRKKMKYRFSRGSRFMGAVQAGFGISGKCDVVVQSMFVYARNSPNLVPESELFLSKTRLPETINSKYSEISPIIASDGNVLYFTVHGSPENTGYTKNKSDQDVYYSEQIDGKWTQRKKMKLPVNSMYPNAVCGVLADNSGLLLGGIYPHYTGLGPLISYKTRTQWGVPQPISIPGFYNEDSQYGFAVSPDGNALVMSLKRKEGLGKRDLYVSLKDENGRWTEPKWMGPIINSPKTETEPYISADGTTMYFASDGRKGYGKCDNYVTRRLDDSWTKWSEPLNLGPNFNTPKDEFGISVDVISGKAYFSSSYKSTGGTDIYSVEIPAYAKPQPIVVLTGSMDTDAPVSIYVYDKERKRLYHKYSADTSVYKIVLQTGKSYFLEWISDSREVFIGYYDAKDLHESKCEQMNVSFKESLPPLQTVKINVVASEDVEKPIKAQICTKTFVDSLEGTYTFDYYSGTLSLQSYGRLPVNIPVPLSRSEPYTICMDPVVVPQSYLESVGADVFEAVKKLEKGRLMFSGNVKFEFGKAELNHHGRDTMDKFCRFLTTKCLDCLVLVLGHTDDVGDKKYNQDLSLMRSNAVRTFIKQRVNWPDEMIYTYAYGETRPALNEKTKLARRTNRRVEVLFYKTG